jgi:hypothetical protein
VSLVAITYQRPLFSEPLLYCSFLSLPSNLQLLFNLGTDYTEITTSSVVSSVSVTAETYLLRRCIASVTSVYCFSIEPSCHNILLTIICGIPPPFHNSKARLPVKESCPSEMLLRVEDQSAHNSETYIIRDTWNITCSCLVYVHHCFLVLN